MRTFGTFKVELYTWKHGTPKPFGYALHAAAHAVDLFCFTTRNPQLFSKVIQNKNTFTTCRPAQHT